MFVEGDGRGGGEFDAFNEPRSKRFFRPSARCLMRNRYADFCRVCSDALAHAVQAVRPE
jgi:hypothetical protein